MDTYILNDSLEQKTMDRSPFSERFVMEITDNNRANYASGQIDFTNMASLSTLDSVLSLNESWFEIPYTVSVTSTLDMTSTKEEMVNAIGLKGFYNLINSFTVNLDNNMLLNVTEHSEIPINFKLLTSFSHDDVNTKGSSINFRGAETNNFTYDATTGETNSHSAAGGNLTAISRNKDQNFIETGLTTFTSIASQQLKRRSYVQYTNKKIVDYHYMATIELKYLSDLFSNMPMIRGPLLKMYLNVHSSTCTLTYNATGIASVECVSNKGSTPFLVADKTLLKAPDTTIVTIKSGISSTITNREHYVKACVFKAVMYKLTPEIEASYFSSPSATIPYTEIIETFHQGHESKKPFKFEIQSSVQKCTYLLMIPLISRLVNGNTTTAIGTTSTGKSGFSTLDSCFTTAGMTCAPYSSITNFNVYIGNRPLYRDVQNSTNEFFKHEISGANSINGGRSVGISASLIDAQAYAEKYGFIFVDLTRKLSDSDWTSNKSIGVSGINSNGYMIDFHCFIGLANEVKINRETSKVILG